MFRSLAQLAFVGIVTPGLFSSMVEAEDYFLTIGGGYSPTGNQISLEKNVLLFQQLVQQQYDGGARHDVLFSDGDDPGRDLQFHDPDVQIPPANLLVARVFRTTKYLEYQYRSHQVPAVRGATSRENLQRWFDEVGRKLKPGDRLFIYATAHGAKSTDEKQPKNTGLYLWNMQKVLMRELVAHLDKVPADVPVVAVMVQCYAGGFANIVFNEGDEQKGPTHCNRCGFFATVHTRPAAGCTADINEENYHEYSSYFWAAIQNKTRTGREISNCDYDGDGAVSLAEAHAYALLESSTIDISVKTSDAFLRAYSKLPPKEPAKKSGTAADPVGKKPAADSGPLLAVDAPFDELVALGTPAERAVLEGLSKQLTLTSPQRAQEVEALAGKIEGEKKALETEIKKKEADLNSNSGRIRQALVNRWPELANCWHPQVAEILQRDAPEVVRVVETHGDYSKFEQLQQELDDLSARKLDHDRRWAKCQRLIHALENVALAANLPKVASAQRQQQYQKLLAAEAATLGRPAGTVKATGSDG